MIVKHFTLGILILVAQISLLNATPLKSELSLRLDAGRGFPVYVEFPSGTDVSVVLRRSEWVKIEDERGIGGWCLLTDLEQAGGANKLQLWRWREGGYADLAWLGVDLYYAKEKRDQGYALSGEMNYSQYLVSAEFEQIFSGKASWSGVYGWISKPWQVNDRFQINPYLGGGVGYGNSASHILGKQGKEKTNLLLATKVSAFYRINSLVRTGITARFASDGEFDQTFTTVSWSWQVRI